VESVSSAWYPPAFGFSGSMVDINGKALFSTRIVAEMENYPAMMGMTFKMGRMAHADDEVAVNETFVKTMRWGDNILNRMVSIDGRIYKVVGLLNDYHTGDFYNEQEPLAVRRQRSFGECIHVRLKEPFADNLKKLNKEASEALSTEVIDFFSLEQKIKENYNSVRVFRNATILSAITLFFIMLMGLIGYTKDEVRRRSKEIAVRKVNGAEVTDILGLLSKNILYIAAPAVAIGTLAAWYINSKWIGLFAEQAGLSPALYPLVAIAVLIVIWGCVIWKSWSIANENPVKSIKSE
jgi:putative ABC transport system permease protein